MIVPFRMHPAVGFSQISGIVAKITDLDGEIVNNGEQVINKPTGLTFSNDKRTGQAKFSMVPIENAEGYDKEVAVYRNRVYGIQIAYQDIDGNVGPFSSVAYGKCIFAPTLGDLTSQGHQFFSCNYKCRTTSEAIAKYRFKTKAYSTNQLLEDSGWLIWDPDNDKILDEVLYDDGKSYTARTSELNFSLKKFYSIAITTTLYIETIGGFVSSRTITLANPNQTVSNEGISIKAIRTFKSDDSWKLRYSLSTDKITQSPIFHLEFGKISEGGSASKYLNNTSVIIFRADNKDEILGWQPLFSFIPTTQQATFDYIDTTVESGVKYRYGFTKGSILDLSNNILVNNGYDATVKETEEGKKYFSYPFYYTEEIEVNLEDTLLSDGDKILPIRFDPKVSSFKETILESKLDTIGSQYPFFFRNGSVRYKEIPISGLVSYQMDEASLFMSEEELLGISKDLDSRGSTSTNGLRPQTTNLEGYDIAAEKRFKLAVLSWLNNGQPKLFRSPTEGNYIIRLMNVSFSPNDTLGRMLHTFSATGYEIGNAEDYEDLRKYKLNEGAVIKWSIAQYS